MGQSNEHKNCTCPVPKQPHQKLQPCLSKSSTSGARDSTVFGGFEEKCNGQPPFLWGMIGGIVQSALNFVFWGGILKCPRIAQSLSNHHHFPITIIFQSPSAHFPTRHWTRGSRLGSLLLPVVKSRPTYWHHLPGFVISSNNNDKYMYI